jgi:hypothetical protein
MGFVRYNDKGYRCAYKHLMSKSRRSGVKLDMYKYTALVPLREGGEDFQPGDVFYGFYMKYKTDRIQTVNVGKVSDENIEALKERLPLMFTRQFRDCQSDCPVRVATSFDNVQYGLTRYSGAIQGYLANPDTDEYFSFTWNNEDLYKEDFVPTIQKGWKAYCEAARAGYRYND